MRQGWFKRISVFFTVLFAEIEYSVRMSIFKRRHPGVIEGIVMRHKHYGKNGHIAQQAKECHK